MSLPQPIQRQISLASALAAQIVQWNDRVQIEQPQADELAAFAEALQAIKDFYWNEGSRDTATALLSSAALRVAVLRALAWLPRYGNEELLLAAEAENSENPGHACHERQVLEDTAGVLACGLLSGVLKKGQPVPAHAVDFARRLVRMETLHAFSYKLHTVAYWAEDFTEPAEEDNGFTATLLEFMDETLKWLLELLDVLLRLGCHNQEPNDPQPPSKSTSRQPVSQPSSFRPASPEELRAFQHELETALRESQVLEHCARTLLILLHACSVQPEAKHIPGAALAPLARGLQTALQHFNDVMYTLCCASDPGASSTDGAGGDADGPGIVIAGPCARHLALCYGLAVVGAGDGQRLHGLPAPLSELLSRMALEPALHRCERDPGDGSWRLRTIPVCRHADRNCPCGPMDDNQCTAVKVLIWLLMPPRARAEWAAAAAAAAAGQWQRVPDQPSDEEDEEEGRQRVVPRPAASGGGRLAAAGVEPVLADAAYGVVQEAEAQAEGEETPAQEEGEETPAQVAGDRFGKLSRPAARSVCLRIGRWLAASAAEWVALEEEAEQQGKGQEEEVEAGAAHGGGGPARQQGRRVRQQGTLRRPALHRSHIAGVAMQALRAARALAAPSPAAAMPHAMPAAAAAKAVATEAEWWRMAGSLADASMRWTGPIGWMEMGSLLWPDWGLMGEDGGAELPPQPPARVAAALSGGLLSTLERLIRRAGEDSNSAAAGVVATHLSSVANDPWATLAPLLAYGPSPAAVALVASLAKAVRRLLPGQMAEQASHAPTCSCCPNRGGGGHGKDPSSMFATPSVFVANAIVVAASSLLAQGRAWLAAEVSRRRQQGCRSAPSEQLTAVLSYALCACLPPLSRLGVRQVPPPGCGVTTNRACWIAAAHWLPVLVTAAEPAMAAAAAAANAANAFATPPTPAAPPRRPDLKQSDAQYASAVAAAEWRTLALDDMGAVPFLGSGICARSAAKGAACGGSPRGELLVRMAESCVAVAAACPREVRNAAGAADALAPPPGDSRGGRRRRRGGGGGRRGKTVLRDGAWSAETGTEEEVEDTDNVEALSWNAGCLEKGTDYNAANVAFPAWPHQQLRSLARSVRALAAGAAPTPAPAAAAPVASAQTAVVSASAAAAVADGAEALAAVLQRWGDPECPGDDGGRGEGATPARSWRDAGMEVWWQHHLLRREGLARELLDVRAALMPPSEARRLLRGCANPGCANLGGDSEAELPLQVCSRCGEAWYCGRECQTAHWRAGHREACGGTARKE